jgi:hypothetical protein
MALASWPACQGQRPSLRGMPQVLVCGLARSPRARCLGARSSRPAGGGLATAPAWSQDVLACAGGGSLPGDGDVDAEHDQRRGDAAGTLSGGLLARMGKLARSRRISRLHSPASSSRSHQEGPAPRRGPAPCVLRAMAASQWVRRSGSARRTSPSSKPGDRTWSGAIAVTAARYWRPAANSAMVGSPGVVQSIRWAPGMQRNAERSPARAPGFSIRASTRCAFLCRASK